jgi:lipoic acid synthetase
MSLSVLKTIFDHNNNANIKSGIMLGLGEKETEIIDTINDLYKTGCRLLSIGQYISPSRKHYPVQEFISQAEFDHYKKIAQALGYVHVESGPYVRSSYHAESYETEKNS